MSIHKKTSLPYKYCLMFVCWLLNNSRFVDLNWWKNSIKICFGKSTQLDTMKSSSTTLGTKSRLVDLVLELMMRACAHSSSAVQIVAITMITPWRHLLRLTWMMIIADHLCLWSSILIRIIGANSFVVGIFGLHSFISWIGAVAWTPLESSHISNIACQRVKKDTRGTDQVYKAASKRTLHRFCIISN